MTIEATDPTREIIRKMFLRTTTREQMAQVYAHAKASGDDIDWQKIDFAMSQRWSESAMAVIRGMAKRIGGVR